MAFYTNTGENAGGIWGGIKKSFRRGSSLTKLLYVNIGLFLLLKILWALSVLFGLELINGTFFLKLLGLPAYWETALMRPWTWFTYMFTHLDFLHLLFNMLWFYWFGSIFLNYFSERELTGLYIAGGLAGALLYILCYSFLPAFEISRMNALAIGASASIMAIVFAVCFYLPNHRIYIFLLGSVKLKYLALFTAAIDIISAMSSNNAGGHIAHLGGAIFGGLFILAFRRNINLVWFIVYVLDKLDRLFTGSSYVKVKKEKKDVSAMTDHEYNEYKRRKDERINKILDKISRSGYDSLTREEKELLFKSGKE